VGKFIGGMARVPLKACSVFQLGWARVLLGVGILWHRQTCCSQYSQPYSLGGSSDAASGYLLCNVATFSPFTVGSLKVYGNLYSPVSMRTGSNKKINLN